MIMRKKIAVLGTTFVITAACMFTGCSGNTGNNSGDETKISESKVNYMTEVLDAYAGQDIETAEKYNEKLPKHASDLEGRDTVYYKDHYQNVLDDKFINVIKRYANEDNSAAIDVDKDGSYEFVYIDSRCAAKAELHVFALRDGTVSEIGAGYAGDSVIHQYPGENGVVLDYCHMGGQNISVMSIDEETGKIVIKDIGKYEYPEGEDYFIPGCEIDISQSNERSPLEYIEDLDIVGKTYSELDETYGMSDESEEGEGGIGRLMNNDVVALFAYGDADYIASDEICVGVTGKAKYVFNLGDESSVEEFKDSLDVQLSNGDYDFYNGYWFLTWFDDEGNEKYITIHTENESDPIGPDTKVEYVNKAYIH